MGFGADERANQSVCRHPAGLDGMDLDGEDEELLSVARG